MDSLLIKKINLVIKVLPLCSKKQTPKPPPNQIVNRKKLNSQVCLFRAQVKSLQEESMSQKIWVTLFLDIGNLLENTEAFEVN